MSGNHWLVRFFLYVFELDWVEIILRAAFLIGCIALGTWIGDGL